MLSGSDLEYYTNKIVYIKTSSGLYLKLENINESNTHPHFLFVSKKNLASEFILIKKSDTNISIRLNNEIKNQNGTFGYHLYTIPDNELVLGAGNDEAFSHFNIEKNNDQVCIRSVHKDAYLCHEFNILRCRKKNNFSSFILEESIIPYVNKSICIISYGYARNNINLTNSPIINTLHEIYPQSQIDLFMCFPKMMDEFYEINYDTSAIINNKCNININIHNNDTKHFMKIAHNQGLPIITNKGKHYSHRTLSTLWNISESIKYFLSFKKVYGIYILMRNDMFEHTKIIKRFLDTNKLCCLNNGRVDPHLFIGHDILTLNYIYDYYIRNKSNFIEASLDQIMYEYLKVHNVQMNDIHVFSQNNGYPINNKKFNDEFYKQVMSKYKEIC